MKPQPPAKIVADGTLCEVVVNGRLLLLSPQEAHDLHQCLGAALPGMVQGFLPWPRSTQPPAAPATPVEGSPVEEPPGNQ